MAPAKATERRLEAEAAQGRRGEVAEREKRLAAERALVDLRGAGRLTQLTESHPEGCPSQALADRWAPVAERLRAWCDRAEEQGLGGARPWVEAVHPHRLSGCDGWVIACHPMQVEWMSTRFQRVFEGAAGAVPVRFVGCNEIVACGRRGQRDKTNGVSTLMARSES
jgi:hypothetical protein